MAHDLWCAGCWVGSAMNKRTLQIPRERWTKAIDTLQYSISPTYNHRPVCVIALRAALIELGFEVEVVDGGKRNTCLDPV